MSSGWGKYYAKTFTGSMCGAGPVVFAVWGYAIANAVPPNGEVELNPKFLSPIIGCPDKDILEAIEYLCSPDPISRSSLEEGKRLLKLGTFTYRLVNFFHYREGIEDESRKAYFRDKMRKFRGKKKLNLVKPSVKDSIDTVLNGSDKVAINVAPSEAEAEAEDKEKPLVVESLSTEKFNNPSGSVKNQDQNPEEDNTKEKLPPTITPSAHETLKSLLTKFPNFPAAKVLSFAITQKKHPAAIEYALEQTLDKSDGRSPGDYFLTILNRTSGNFYEQEYIESKADEKNLFTDILKRLETIKES